MHLWRIVRFPVFVVVLCVAAACGGTEGVQADEQARARWDAHGPEHYRFIWYRSGMVGESRIAVEVRDGVVVASRPLEDPLRVMEDGGPPTVEGAFRKLRQARSTADEVEVSYDRELGYPRSVSVDRDLAAVDDEYEFGIRELERGLP